MFQLSFDLKMIHNGRVDRFSQDVKTVIHLITLHYSINYV